MATTEKRVKVGVDVVTSVDKKALDDLQNQLIRLSVQGKAANVGDNLKQGLIEAGKEASKLSDILQDAYNSKLNQLDFTKVNNSIKETWGSAENLGNVLVRSGSEGAEAFASFSSMVLNSNIQLKQSSQILDRFATTFKNTVRYGISSSIFNNLSNSLQKAYNYTKNLDTSLNNIRIVSNKSAEDMERFAVQANKAAQALGKATLDYTNASLIYYQQGLSDEEVEARTNVTLKAANVTGQSAQEVSEQLTAVWNGYNVSIAQSEEYIDKLAAVAASTAADLEELSTGMSKVASAANAMGVPIDSLNAQLATIVSVTRQAPESVGTALRTIYARMADIEAGLDDEVSLGSYTEQMKALGINVLDAEGHLRNMGDVITEVGDNWGKMSREQQVALAQVMAGTRQYNNLLALFGNWDMYNDALQTSLNSTGELQRQQDIYMESAEAHLQQLRTEAEKIYATIFDQETAKDFIDVMNGALSVLNSYLQGLGGGMQTLTTLGLQAANIFSKQISGGISRQIQNREITKNTAAAGESKEALAEYLYGDNFDNLSSETRERVTAEYEVYDRIRDVASEITDEEYQRLVKMQEEYGVLAKQYEIAKKTKEEILASKDVQPYVEKGKNVEEILDTALGTTEIQIQVAKERIANKEIDDQNEEYQELLATQERLIALKQQSNNLTEEDIDNIYRAYTQLDKQIQQYTDIKKRQKDINTIVRGTTVLLSTITSVSGIWKTINDKDLSGWEKFSNIISVVAIQGIALYKNWDSIKNLLPTLAKALNTTDTSLLGVSKAALTTQVSLFGLEAPLWAIITAAGALVAIGYQIYQRVEADNIALNELNATITETAQRVSDLTDAYNTLKTEISNFQSAKDALKDMEKGTTEWKEAVIQLNSQVLELMDKYPRLLELGAITKDELTGSLDITDKGLDTILSEQLEKVQLAQHVNLSAQIDKTKFQIELEAKDLIKELSDFRFESKDTLNRFASTISKNADIIANGSTDQIRTLLEDANIRLGNDSDESIERLRDSILDNIDHIGKYTSSIEGYTSKIEGYTDALLGENKSNTSQEDYNKIKQQKEQYVESLSWEEILNSYNRLEGGNVASAKWSFSNAGKVLGHWFNNLFVDLDSKATGNTLNRLFNLYPESTNALGKKLSYKIVDEKGNSIAPNISMDTIKKYLIQNLTDEELKMREERAQDIIDTYNETAPGLGDFLQLFGKDDAIQEINKRYTREQIEAFQTQFEQHPMQADTNQDEKSTTEEWNAYFREGLGLTDVNLNNIFEETLKNFDPTAYLSQAKTSLKEATKQGEVLDILSLGDVEEISEEQDQYLTELEQKYEELGEIKNRTSHEYLETLREIKEQEEENAKDLYKTAREHEDEQLDDLMGQLSEAELRNASNEEKEQIVDQIEEVLQAIEDTDFSIKVAVKADLQSDVDDAFGLADEIGQLHDSINEGLEYTFDEAQDLINKGYGAILQNAHETADQTIKLDQAVVDNFVNGKQAELEADRLAKIEQLENEKVLLEEQKSILVAKLNALEVALGAETEADAAAALQEAQIEEVNYQNSLKVLNAQLEDQKEVTNKEQDINQGLYTALGGMYETDSENEQQAEKDATDNNKKNIDARINNVKALYSAYQQLARQIKASENGEVLGDLNVSGTQGGVAPSTTGSKEVKVEYSDIDALLKEKDLGLVDEVTGKTTDRYRQTVQAVIDQTKSQIQALDNQIGAADAGIAALKSANESLDKWQKEARTAGSGSGKDAKYENYLDDEADRYHKVDTQIQKVENSLSKVQSQQDKLVGKSLIDNLSQQWNLLNTQVENYNEKLRIARDEQSELKDELAKQGVAFNADGAIQNYMEAFQAQEDYVNGLIDQYNKLSAKQQEAWDEAGTVDAAKEKFDKFKENMDRYDELVSDFIPGLEQDIIDNIDEQIDLQIQAFNLEIEVRLDMAEAERDWNEFKKRIIDGIKEDDILGNARARLLDFSSYYNEAATGEVQALTKQVNGLLDQLYQQDADGGASSYGDDRAQALADLKDYYTQLMESLESVLDLQEEIHEAYLDMIDEAQEKFDEQIDTYETLRDLIEHDMNVIELVYGEEAYSQLSKYYDRQEENYNKQLEFQRMQKDFWYAQMQTMEEGSEEWQAAKENWLAAVDEWNSAVEEAIENLQDKYLNAINEIFQRLNDQATSGKGLDYIEEEWELINKNAEQYLDTVDATWGIQKLENKYMDAYDQTDSIQARRQIKKIMDEELANLREQDKLTQYDIDRANMRYDIMLKQIALQEAQQNKSQMRLRRDSQGNYSYQFVADDDQIGQLQDELGDLYNSLYDFDKEHYLENLNQMYDLWVEFQEKMAEAAQINDPEARAERELLLREQYEPLLNGILEENLEIRNNLNESAFDDLAYLYEEDAEKFRAMTEEEKQAYLEELIPQMKSGTQELANYLIGEGGFLPAVQEALDELDQATQNYEDGLVTLQNQAGQSFGDIASNIDDTIVKTQELIQNNGELINSYEEQLQSMRDIIDQLDAMIEKYGEFESAAKSAATEAKNYWIAASNQNANEYAESQSKGEITGAGSTGPVVDNTSSTTTTTPQTSSSNNTGTSTGDGVLNKGDVATYSGRYYHDSYGGNPSGSAYSGVTNGIIVDMITKNPYGIHIKSADGRYKDLGWIKKSQLSGYDTGGYTGDWDNNGGRLALLHQKELVLNSTDTENILNAVNVIRTLGSAMLSRLSAVAANSDVGTFDDMLNQNVSITATFPNVTSSNEIEDALNNLVNRASQRIGRRR